MTRARLGASELVVEGDRGGQAAEPLKDVLAQAWERAGAVALSVSRSLQVQRFDSIRWRIWQVWAVSGLVASDRSHERRVAVADGGCERAAGVPLVAQQHLAAVTVAVVQQDQADARSSTLGEVSCSARGVPVGAEDLVQPKPPRSSASTSRTSRSRRLLPAPIA